MTHAYLIMAHSEIEILKLLLRKLDAPNNTLYIHFDAKFPCNFQELLDQVHFSKIHFINRIDVRWGKYSQIQCELDLLRAAVTGNYDYYHLITGVDLPIKSTKEIDSFFEQHKGTEFIAFDKVAVETRNFTERYDRWHFIISYVGSNCFLKLIAKLCNKFLQALGILFQLILGNRSKKYPHLTFMKGSAYFDISHDLATYILTCEPEIKRIFTHTVCCDEVFLQTFAYNSPFREKISTYSTRYIDWSKHLSNPEILTIEHYNAIAACNHLFARKFSSKQSGELIKKLYGIEFP